MMATAAALAVLVSTLQCATSRILLEIKPSRIPNAGLGLFLSSTSDPSEPGTVLTEYGTEYVEAVDIVGTLWEDYAMGVPGRPDLIRVSVPWNGEVPSTVEGPLTPVGHIANDGAAVLCAPAHTGVHASKCVTAEENARGGCLCTGDCEAEDSCRWREREGAGGYGCATLKGVEALVESYRREALRTANAGFNASPRSAEGEHGGRTHHDGSRGRTDQDGSHEPPSHQPFNFNMVATRRIAPGEEILHAYGDTYWLHRAMRHTREPSVRLALYLYQAKHHPETFVAPHALPHAWLHSVHEVDARTDGGELGSNDALDGGRKGTKECVVEGSQPWCGGGSKGFTPTMSDTRRATSEEWCEGFVVGNLGYAAKQGEGPRGFCKVLAAMFAAVLDDGGSEVS